MKQFKFKIIGIVVLAIMLSIFATVSVKAENDSLAPAQGTLVIHKFLLEDMSEATTSGTGYVTDSANIPVNATPLKDIVFKIYKITPNEPVTDIDGNYPAQGEYTLDDAENPTILTDVRGNTFTVVEASIKEVTTASNGEASLTLSRGIYLVVEQESELTNFVVEPFVVSLPMTNPAGDGWVETVHVYPKNEDLRIEKIEDKETASIGEIVKYTITSSIPSNTIDGKSFDITDPLKVTDELETALEYVQDTLSVKVSASKDEDGLVLPVEIPDSGYYTFTTDDNIVKISFTKEGLEYLYNNGERYKFIQIEFDARVTENLLKVDTRLAINEATVTLVSKVGATKTRTTAPVNIHTASIEIFTFLGETEIPVENTTYKIASSEEDARAGRYIRKLSNGTIILYGEPDYAKGTDIELTSDVDGRVAFQGLRDYILVDGEKQYLSYFIVTTKVPDEFNMLMDPVKVTFGETETESNGFTRRISISLNKGFVLPITGGTGTIIFTIVGIILIGTAVILLFIPKKRKDKEDKEEKQDK